MIRTMLIVVAAACALAATSLAGTALAQSNDDVARARVIVKYKAGSPLLSQGATTSAAARHAAQAQALGERVGIALASGAGLSERAHVVTARGITSEALARRLAAESDVEYAVPDRRVRALAVPNDPLYASGPPISGTVGGPASGQWYLRAPSGEVQSSINAESAWDVVAGGTTIVVGMIDTGVRYDHRDLLSVAAGGHLLPGYDMISDTAVANDGDGRDPDASDPGDWLTDAEISDKNGPFYQCDTQADPSSWHGTQTAGIVGALSNNGIGMTGAARNVLLLPVRVLGKCGGYESDVIAAMLWASGLSVPGVPANPTPARVLNLSLGGDGGCSSAYADAVSQVNAAGVVVVAAAGNDAGHAVGTPANCPGVIAVTALRHVGTKVGFSDLGPNVAISAPGGNCVNTGASAPCLYPILTTSNSGSTTPVPDASGGSIYTDAFNASVGTSFATPLVAATAAMMLSVQPTLAPPQVRALMQASARPFPTTGGTITNGTPPPVCAAPQPIDATQVDQLECYCTTSTCGAGMLDAAAAVRAAAGGSTNYTGLFWQSPAGVASGWGINFAHVDNQIFATWYTYDATGKPWWLSMLATRPTPTSSLFSGPIYVDTGPPFNAFNGTASPTPIGYGQLAMTDADNGTFSYTVNSISQIKPLTRFDLGTGPRPACLYTPTTPDFAAASNFQGLWWAADGTEAGWGINFAHQGNAIYATWYTYDANNAPLWLSVLATSTGGAYSGTLYRSAGPTFSSYDSSQWSNTPVGSAMITFSDGNHATFSYSTTGQGGLPISTQSKAITRFPFASSGGTLCR